MVTISELGERPRLNGRAAKAVRVSFVRELGDSDLALLASERGTEAPRISKLRDRHHALARVLAQGMTNAQASLVTGYDPSRISILKSDPGFKELVADYARIEDGLAADFADRAGILTLTAMNNLQEALEDDENPLPASMTLEIAKTFADRTGHAPVQKSLSVNLNVGMGERIKASRERAAQAYLESQPAVDAEFTEVKSG